MARVWRLVSRPNGMVRADNFALIEQELPPTDPGQARVRNVFVSVEPAMRALMVDVPGYRAALKIGEPVSGRAVGRIVESRDPSLQEGDLVYHYLGWRDEAVADASAFTRLPEEGWIPEEYWLSVLGMPGLTAYFGLLEAGKPKAGETLFVSAAAGSVGSNVLQIGKVLGLTVIGSAGGPDKLKILRELGADGVIDYKLGDIAGQLHAVAPQGIDVYFDNVGGEHLDAALANARQFARFAECGMIETYNFADARQKVPFGHTMRIISSQISIRGFIVDEFEHRLDEFRGVMRAWLREDKIRPLLTISEGVEKTAETFVGLFQGRNLGKALVRI